MLKIVLVLLAINFGQSALAQEPCSQSPLLGAWLARSLNIETRNHQSLSCAKAAIDFSCGKNNELRVRWAYACGTWMDWLYGNQETFPLSGERILGQDGFLSNTEFYWDGLIPMFNGTKIQVKLLTPNSATLEISEDPKSYYPENIFRGTLERVAAPDPILEPQNHFPADKIHGNWTGQIRILGEKETICPVNNWQLDFNRHVLFQTRIYLPECQEEVNFWLGPSFVRGDEVFDHPKDQSRNLVKVGVASATGYSRTYQNYIVQREEVTLGENTLLYRFFTRGKEYRLELKRP